MYVYAFQHCHCIYESSFYTMSIHLTYKGAYKRMKKHKLDGFQEWIMQSKFHRLRYKFGAIELWDIIKIKIED
jgi:hypothetical protein